MQTRRRRHHGQEPLVDDAAVLVVLSSIDCGVWSFGPFSSTRSRGIKVRASKVIWILVVVGHHHSLIFEKQEKTKKRSRINRQQGRQRAFVSVSSGHTEEMDNSKEGSDQFVSGRRGKKRKRNGRRRANDVAGGTPPFPSSY